MLLLAAVTLMLVDAPAQEATNRFLLLRLRLNGDSVTLINASVAAGTLKPQQDSDEPESLLIHLEDATGKLQWSTLIADPSIRRYEYEDPQEPGALRTKIVQLDDAEVIVRAPLLPDVRHLAVHRKQTPQDRAAAPETRLLSRISLPVPEEAPFQQLTPTQIEAATMQVLRTNGPTANRLNIVFLSEGYTTNDLSHFVSDATVMLNAFLIAAPFREYSNYFNAFAISVPSNQSGSDHYTPTTNLVDTYFNSRYDSSGIQRLITIDGTGSSRVNALLTQFMPEYDIVALVVNDTVYGGSGGFPLISSINASSPEIANHEMGHSFAGLGDEYSSAGGSPSEKPNTTAKTNLTDIKWNIWIPAGTPIPTPDVSSNFNVIGLFQGAAYSTNYYRPKHDCKMRTLGVSFCAVCAEALVKSIYSHLRPIESFSPATNLVLKLTNGLASSFAVSNQIPSTHSLAVQWFLNGSAILNATSAVVQVSGFDLPTGTNVLSVTVKDPTAFVRNDPSNVSLQTMQWRVRPIIVAPTIGIARGAGQVTLAWPSIAAGFSLESAASLSTPQTWGPLLLISNQTGVSFPPGVHALYRLHRP